MSGRPLARSPALRILCVEDDEILRHMLGRMLELAGYDVLVARSVDEALALLRAGPPVHLLITDFDLGRRTGAELLSEAQAQGLLEGTVRLMLTGRTDVSLPGLEVLVKPVDVDELLAHVHRLLAPARAQALEHTRREVERGSEHMDANAHRIELVLYISSASAASLRALRTLNSLLTEFEPTQVLLRVHDLSTQPPQGEDEERIVFTPTLVRRRPEPRLVVIGDLRERHLVVDLLEQAGVDRKKP